MKIKKEYKFYASHRNQELVGSKCVRPHGHQYLVFCVFNVTRNGSISTLFDDFDCKLEPMFKDEFDHRMLIDINDNLLHSLRKHESSFSEDLGLKVLPFSTSVENICYYLFKEITTRFDFDLAEIQLQETRTATIIYTKEDYEKDKSFFDKVEDDELPF